MNKTKKINFIEFTNADKVGVASIDNQHKSMVETVNKIYNSLLLSKESSALNYLKKFLELVKAHFQTEEKLMRETNFPGFYSHKLEHDRFYKQILNYTDRFHKEFQPIGKEQLEGIRKWFFNHLEISDKKCGKFLHEKGFS